MGITVHAVIVAGLCYLPHHIVSAGFNCTFDTNTCGWTQDQGDKLDWIRHSGDTDTAATGPSADHTSGYGFYMYIDSPGSYTPGHTARLISPAINGEYQMCLVFYYHMYGHFISTLSVYFSRNGSLGSPVWTKLYSQGNVWNRGTVQIDGGSTTTAVTNVVFEAVEGAFHHADIAIDDVSLQGGTCPQEPYRTIRLISPLNNGIGRIEVYHKGIWGTVCDNGFTDQTAEVACRQLGMLKSWSQPTTLTVDSGSDRIWLDDIHCNGNETSLAECDHSPWGSHSCSHYQDVGVNCDNVGMNCTFDTNTCDWTQGWRNQFNWTRSSAGSPGNGPDFDHTSGDGSYMYIDTSYPDTQDRGSNFASPALNGTTVGCLEFYYYMFGLNVSRLNVYLHQITPRQMLLWTKDKSQGNAWRTAVVQITGTSPALRIIFEGIRGAGYHGTIAIDDVSLTPGTCQQAASESEGRESGDVTSGNITVAIVGGVVAVVVIAVIVAVIVYLNRRRRLQSGTEVMPQRMRNTQDGKRNPSDEQKNAEAEAGRGSHLK